MIRKIELSLGDGYIHYQLDNEYLGMLVFEKGELSDFRAIVRKNRLSIDMQNLAKTLKLCLHELLNRFLLEREYVTADDLQKLKIDIIKANDEGIASAVKTIGNQGVLVK